MLIPRQCLMTRMLISLKKEQSFNFKQGALAPKKVKSVYEKTRKNQAGVDTAQITDFAQTRHKCWVW